MPELSGERTTSFSMRGFNHFLVAVRSPWPRGGIWNEGKVLDTISTWDRRVYMGDSLLRGSIDARITHSAQISTEFQNSAPNFRTMQNRNSIFRFLYFSLGRDFSHLRSHRIQGIKIFLSLVIYGLRKIIVSIYIYIYSYISIYIISII